MLFVGIGIFSKEEKTSGNPILPGWYADPEVIVYGDEYWIYPTLSGLVTADGKDLDTGKKTRAVHKSTMCRLIWMQFLLGHCTLDQTPEVLSIENIQWLEFALWAPSVNFG